jgi:putative ABC transport system permease protein
VMLAIKTVGDPTALASAVTAAVHDIDPSLPVSAMRTMDEVEALATAQRRFQLNLVLVFAVAAMLLAGLGIYGVLAYAVRQRTSEIGTRLALGAAPAALRRAVVKDALRLVAAGLAVGVPLALVVARSLRALLFGIAPYDPITVVGVCLILTMAAWLAAYLPARRASRVDPMVALRCD